MLKKIRIKNGFKVFAGCLVLFSLIGFVEKKSEERVCNKIIINIDNEFENYFVDEKDVTYLLNGVQTLDLVGKKFSSINLKYLEQKVETNKFVKDAQIFNDLKGNLIVNVYQMRPVARLINSFGGGHYISTESTILPVSSKFASRVIVISGAYTKKLTNDFLQKEKEGKALIELIAYIENDEFLKPQIAQLDISSNGEIIMYPQIGSQFIEFGKAEDIDLKFRKLKAFYKKILPVKGWGAYEKISLKYENQIVCE